MAAENRFSTTSVSREFRWEAAHRIVQGYSGKCSHLHGHNWTARVTVTLRAGQGLSEAGFVRDFADFRLLAEWIEKFWDHATLVAESDATLRSFLHEHRQKHYVTHDNPSCEVLATELHRVAAEHLEDERCMVTEVIVRETASSEALLTILRG